MLIAFSAIGTLRTWVISKSMCLGVFQTNVAEMGSFCFSEQKSIQAGSVSDGKYQVDGFQDSALRLETEHHSNCSCFCSSTLICDS